MKEKSTALLDLLTSAFFAVIFIVLTVFVSILLPLLVFIEGHSGILLLFGFISIIFLYVAWLFIKDVIDDIKVIFRRKRK